MRMTWCVASVPNSEGEEEDLSDCLLKAVINLHLRSQETTTAAAESAEADVELARIDGVLNKALELAVKWDRPGVATKVLDRLSAMRQAFPDGAGSTPAVRGALRLAIEMARTKFVSKLVGLPGIQLQNLNMMRLCAQAASSTFCQISCGR